MIFFKIGSLSRVRISSSTRSKRLLFGVSGVARRGSEMGAISWRVLILLFLLACFAPIALLGWQDLYSGFLEKNAPTITVLDVPRGIGLLPVSLRLEIFDPDSGIDEIVVRATQRTTTRELLREKLEGRKKGEIEIAFNGRDSGFEQGKISLEVRAFDRSLWSNTSQQDFEFLVDYRRPQLEVLTSQHNVREGGGQLIFYRATDDNLAVSGVKVGNRTFLGFPARRIDPDFNNRPDVHLALFAVPLQTGVTTKTTLRVFAEDRVGNATSSGFHHQIMPRRISKTRVAIRNPSILSVVRSLVEKYQQDPTIVDANTAELFRLNAELNQGEDGAVSHRSNFEFAYGLLATRSEAQLQALLGSSRYDFFWNQALNPQQAVVRRGYASEALYSFSGEDLANEINRGYLYSALRAGQDIQAAGAGIVHFVENIGALGNVIGIDHGLGLMTTYAFAGSVSAQKGRSVTAGETIGTFGRSGLGWEQELLFQVRIQGEAVDPTELLSKAWYFSHVTSKINETKRVIGIPVYAGF